MREVGTFRRRPRADEHDTLIGDEVRAQRQRAGLSQRRLGEMIGVSFQQMYKYERGTDRITASRLNLIAGALGIPLTRFFATIDARAGGPEEAGPTAPDPERTAQNLRLIRAFLRMKAPDVRERVVALVESAAAHGPAHAARSAPQAAVRRP